MIPLLDDSGRYHELQLSVGFPTDRLGVEQLGSKKKFWTLLKGEQQPWLFKYARSGTGEHWSEKLGSELARLIGLPSARAELADIDGEPGILVESIVPHVWDENLKQPLRMGELVHGNEILSGYLPDYDKVKHWGQSEHSFDNIVGALGKSVPPERLPDVMTRFAGLLVLDALIGNTDRHHENWALLWGFHGDDVHLELAPSYDHASSLGRELTVAKRSQLLKDGRVGEYIRRGNGAIFGEEQGRHADNPLGLVVWASQRHPDWFSPWLEAVGKLQEPEIVELLDRMPIDFIDALASDFCREFLTYTINELRKV